MDDILALLNQWQLDLKAVRTRVYRYPTSLEGYGRRGRSAERSRLDLVSRS
jgi:hypothetical protein